MTLKKQGKLFFYHQPCISSGGNSHLDIYRIVSVQLIGNRSILFLPDLRHIGEAGVIKRKLDGTGDSLVGRVEQQGKAFLLSLRIDMHKAIPVTSVGTAQVNQFAVQDIPVFLVPVDHLHHGSFRLRGIVQTGTTVTSLYTGPIVLDPLLSR